MGVDPEAIERWLAARDHVTIRDAWTALPSTRHRLEVGPRRLTWHGAAQLAEAMLGERADWLVERAYRAPTYEHRRISDAAFLDHVWDIREPNNEAIAIHERRDGLRGVQKIGISSSTIEGRPEGGGVNVARIFDRDRAAVIPIDHWGEHAVAVIGEIDLAPLDLFAVSRSFTLATDDRDHAAIRGLVAQLVAESDAHFDTCATWPTGPNVAVPYWHHPDIRTQDTVVDGTRAVTIGIDTHGRIWAEAIGLPWGHRLGIRLDARSGYLSMQFPSADLDRIEARVASIGHLT